MNKRLLYLLIIALGLLTFCDEGYGQAPVINSFAPASGTIGSQVVISGSNFNPSTGGNIVYFGATRATVTGASPTSLTVKVPVGATFQPITVLNTSSHLTTSSSYPFRVTFPSKGTITSVDFDARIDFAAAGGPARIAIGDLDGDGKADMATAYQNISVISLYHNVATQGAINVNSLQRVDMPSGTLSEDISFGDVDGDGKLDIITANGGYNTISIYRNISVAGTLNASSFAAKVDIVTDNRPTSVRLGDLDGDGKPDLVVTYSYVGTILSIIKNNSVPGVINAAAFAPRVDIDTGNGYIAPFIADINHDNKPEIILAETAFSRISVYENISTAGTLSSASFAPKVTFNTQTLPATINLGDMNGDGKPDLITSNYGATLLPVDVSNTFIGVLLSNISNSDISSASYGAVRTRIAEASPLSLALDDLDGDGKLDVVTANAYRDNISIYHNTSTSTVVFDNRIDIASGLKPLNIKIADVDGDGKPDIIVTNSTSQTISIYRNNSNNEQTITFPPLQPVVYGTADFNPGAISNNPGNPFIYTSSNPAVATITSGGLIHIVGVGTTTITVNQNATANVDAAIPKSQDLKVLPAPLNIKADDQSRPYGIANPTLTATYTGLVYADNISDLGISYNINSVADINSLPGTYPITATGDAASANYTITYTSAVLTINKLIQTITFDAITDKSIGDDDFVLYATATSGLPVTYSSANSDIAGIIGNTVHINKVGTVNITATQPGNDIYEPAIAVVRSLKVAPLRVTILSNTITPNGDGVNDTWIIQGLDYDVSGTVSIYNRNGGVVFQSRGYPIPFNGTRNGKKLPAGVYYYVINFSDRRTSLSGSLTILY